MTAEIIRCCHSFAALCLQLADLDDIFTAGNSEAIFCQLQNRSGNGIMRLLERINRTGTTVLVATHDREMVDNMRRRVIALERGHLTRDQQRGVYGFDV